MSSFPSIAIASGKGGTGKTTVAVHLAAWLAGRGEAVQYLDCDVEEPNGHLFLKPVIETAEPAAIPVPVVDNDRCTACGKCAAACEFNAVAMLKKPMVFTELCHGCGACTLVCPVEAIREEPRDIGTVETGQAGPIRFAQGRLNVGEPMSPPLIRAVKNRRDPAAIALFDSPPGTSCPVIAAVRAADFIVLVTEPSPFGLHDLTLAVETFRPMDLPFGVVVNRADPADLRVQDFCRQQEIPVLAELPDDRRVAETYARGELLFDRLPEWRDRMAELWARIEERL
ncbi:MAG TPA: ATP-binding protein [Kiritimatiellia bacterium]|nr:ATP-binding protein [Kiritimatiellia bacterium]HRX07124.1 ATP-binding protein [Kiritimatiellia bacterium]